MPTSVAADDEAFVLVEERDAIRSPAKPHHPIEPKRAECAAPGIPVRVRLRMLRTLARPVLFSARARACGGMHGYLTGNACAGMRKRECLQAGMRKRECL